ncbi:MAG: extensin family protein [Proteobacteria bacterium]|nr:extensin family protein [Pseudomonadota bacterium]
MLRFDHAYPFFVRALRGAGLLATLGAALSGCGFRFAEPREAWRGQAEAACMKSGLVRESSFVRQIKPIDGPGPCGADLPLRVAAFEVKRDTLTAALASAGAADFGLGNISGVTNVKPEATLGCPMVAWTEDWIAGAVQPAALAWFGQGVRELRAGSYACRRRNHNPNARLSEHSYGNALDIMAFVLNDGNVVTVKGGWRGTEQEQGFLRDVFFEACQRFKTVLGPGSDALHYDHFHLDLAHHDAQGKRRYCKPQVAAPQRPFPGTYGPGVNSYPQMNAYAPPPVPNLNSSMIASNTPAYRVPPPLAARPQQPLPAPTSGMESGNINETEPEFDPRDFDLATGSITPLPEPKPVPRVIKTPRRKSAPPASSRGMAYDPAGRN